MKNLLLQIIETNSYLVETGRMTAGEFADELLKFTKDAAVSFAKHMDNPMSPQPEDFIENEWPKFVEREEWFIERYEVNGEEIQA